MDPILETLEIYKKAAPLCEEHKPDGGARGNCLVCGLMKLSAALSEIDYLCGPPNNMHVSDYDIYYDENAVVEKVRKLLTFNKIVV